MKIINACKIDPSIKEVLKKLVNLNLKYYVLGGLLCQYYLKEHARLTKDIDIVFDSDPQIVEEELKKTFGDISFFYSKEMDNFYEPSFTCSTKINGLLGQLEGKRIDFLSEIKEETYSYEGITFKGVTLEYIIADKISSLLNDLARPYKHLVDIYSFSKIDQLSFDKDEVKRYLSLINEQENKYRKSVNIKEYKLPNQIPENKIFTPPYVIPTLQSKHNVSKEEMIAEVNKWLKNVL